MSKELKALIRIEDLLNMLYETDVIDDDHTHDINIIGKKLKRLEELEKAFVTLSKEDEKTKKLLSKEIEKNRAFEIIKTKKVNIMIFLGCDNLEEYNRHPLTWNYLIQDEYDLIKEVLL